MTSKQQAVTVVMGQSAAPVGELVYSKDGRREYTAFAYDEAWLTATERFDISPDLMLVTGHQYRKSLNKEDSIFHFAFADSEPDGWGCRVIARDHAKRRNVTQANGKSLSALTEMDYLLGVDDTSRVGALRFVDSHGRFLRATGEDGRGTPPLLELQQLIGATRAVEMNKETAADLHYLRGKGTSLGGMRPKCSVLDDDGHLAIGKFPSVQDDRCVTRGEVLALQLATIAGIQAAESRIVMSDNIPVTLVRRFDRTANGDRIPYLSAGSLLQASRTQDYAYSQIADVILTRSAYPLDDLQEIWRRMLFNLLITNVDDHVHNHGFLHVEHGQWRLAPAFDINPFPDKDQVLKLWLNEDYGPVDSIDALMAEAPYFRLSKQRANDILAQVCHAISHWKKVAMSPQVGMSPEEIEAFIPAFENAQVKRASQWLG